MRPAKDGSAVLSKRSGGVKLTAEKGEAGRNIWSYVLNCSANIRLVDVPVMVVKPPMVDE